MPKKKQKVLKIILNNVPTYPDKVESQSNFFHSYYKGGPKDEIFGPLDFIFTYNNNLKLTITQARFKWIDDFLVIRGDVEIDTNKRRRRGRKKTTE